MATIGLGFKGDEVKRLQTRLNELEYRDDGNRRLAEDGSFGQKTEQAVNSFKDAVLPDGNKGENRGKVGDTTWEYLNAAEPLNPQLAWIPPFEYNDGGLSWPEKDIADFLDFESGNKLSWNGCTAKLRAANVAFEAELKTRGYSVRYTSAYRPLIYQAHFYDIYKGPASMTAAGRAHCLQHGIKSASYPRRTGSPHILGIAWDCRVTDAGGKVLNPDGGVADMIKVICAHCGLKVPPAHDTVHFELIAG